jgi:hypothetical protein
MDSYINLAIGLVVIYITIRYIIPFIWNNLLVPLGKIAYFIILVILAFAFYLAVGFGEEAIPIEIKAVLIITTSIVAAVKWANSRKL